MEQVTDRMSLAAAVPEDVASAIEAHVARYADKVFDWGAFPASIGYPELDRAQIRYIGAGGSNKVDDPRTFKPDHFTLSIVHQPPGKYGASHSHEVPESFTVLEGVLTVGWEWDGTVVQARLGPKDMILHAVDRPHGFRNDGVDPVKISIMVGKGRPLPPNYLFHPRSHSTELSAAFGAEPGHTVDLDFGSEDPRHREMASHIVRYSQKRPEWHPSGFARMTYIGQGGAPAGTYRSDLIHLPRGNGVRAYERPVEEAFLVIEGCLVVGWDDGGQIAERRLGPRDLILTPPGRRHYFRNDGVSDTQFFMVVGTPEPETVAFTAL